jgi:hypothetical protein
MSGYVCVHPANNFLSRKSYQLQAWTAAILEIGSIRSRMAVAAQEKSNRDF